MARVEGPNVGYSYYHSSSSNTWNLKIRNILSQFSDVFSEFNKYIAPAYHHDRCERSVQMRLYSMHKGEFVMVFVGFFAFFGLGVFIGLAGPSITSTTAVHASKTLKNVSDLSYGPFYIKSPPLGSKVQQLWLLAGILTDNNDEEIFDKSFQVSISIEGLNNAHQPVTLVHENDSINRTRHLRCEKQVCGEILILHLGALQYTHYVLKVHFYGLESFHKRYHIRDIIFYFKTYNPAFTQIEIWFRFIFLLGSFSVTCWFMHFLRKYTFHDWSIEQKWISILLPLLLFFNDPFFPLRLVSNSCIGSVMDMIFQTTFIAIVLLSWLCLYHGLRQNEHRFILFYAPKLVVVGLLWIPAIILGLWQKYYAFHDPTFNYKTDVNYYSLKVFFFVSLGVYFFYLLLLVVRAYTELKNMPFFDVRLRCLSTLIGSVLSIMFALIYHDWGPAALQDHWASKLNSHYETSASFMTLYSLANFYMYTLAYLYSPATGSIHEVAITKDNPTFSMINDSDEEVIYGSDEESRRPLNRSHNQDDSD